MSNIDKMLSDLSSVSWWFTAVFVALLINLISAYAKPWLDRWIDRQSLCHRARRTKRRQDFEDQVDPLISDPYLLLMERLNELRCRIDLVYFLIGCILMFGLAAYFSRSTTVTPFLRYLLTGFTAGNGLLAYLFFLRLVVRSTESARRCEAALQKLPRHSEG